MFIAGGDDEDAMGVGFFQLGQAPSSPSLEDRVLQVIRRNLAAFVTSRFRNIENDVEANFSHQQRDECPILLPSQLRHSKARDTFCFKKPQQKQ